MLAAVCFTKKLDVFQWDIAVWVFYCKRNVCCNEMLMVACFTNTLLLVFQWNTAGCVFCWLCVSVRRCCLCDVCGGICFVFQWDVCLFVLVRRCCLCDVCGGTCFVFQRDMCLFVSVRRCCLCDILWWYMFCVSMRHVFACFSEILLFVWHFMVVYVLRFSETCACVFQWDVAVPAPDLSEGPNSPTWKLANLGAG